MLFDFVSEVDRNKRIPLGKLKVSKFDRKL